MMMRNTSRIAIAALVVPLLAVTQGTWGEEAVEMVPFEVDGIVYELDRPHRLAIISGYAYSFGVPGTLEYPEVKMADSDFGSYELLQIGMKVHVEYEPGPEVRRVIKLVQWPDDTEIVEF